MLLGILCLIFIFWPSLRKSGFLDYKDLYIFFVYKILKFSILIHTQLDCDHKSMLNHPFRGQDVLLLNTGLGDEEEQQRIKELLLVDSPKSSDETGQFCSYFFLSF